MGPLHRFTSLALVMAFLALPSVAEKPRSCTADDGECLTQATYYEDTNYTVWVAWCTDGSQGGGILGGDELAGLCGY